MTEIRGKSVLILGYGREGKSVHRHLMTYYPKIHISIADRGKVTPLKGNITNIYDGPDYLDHIANYDTIIRSPGIPFNHPKLTQTIHSGKHLTTAMNIFFADNPGIVIGVTGTKGKSTTSALIAHVLTNNFPDVRLVGNIGNPCLDYLPDASHKTYFVAELSSHQLEDIRYSPHIAVLLAINPEHLDHFGSFDRYIEAKSQIVRYQKQTDYVVFNPKHKRTYLIAQKSKAIAYAFSLYPVSEAYCFADKEIIYLNATLSSEIKIGDQLQAVMPVSNIPLLGIGNLENTLAAISVSTILGLSAQQISKRVQSFKALAHRLEFVGVYRGVKYYNDSLATTPEATIHALEALRSSAQTLIAGGFDRGLDYSALGDYIGKSSLKTIILFPSTGGKIWEAVINSHHNSLTLPTKYTVTTMQEAVEIAIKRTGEGKICLLSPAAASFGTFKDYEDRGNQFKTWIQKLNSS